MNISQTRVEAVKKSPAREPALADLSQNFIYVNHFMHYQLIWLAKEVWLSGLFTTIPPPVLNSVHSENTMKRPGTRLVKDQYALEALYGGEVTTK